MRAVSRWKPGDTVVLRGVWRNRLWWASAATVVQDTPGLLALYWQAGTPEKALQSDQLPMIYYRMACVWLIGNGWKQMCLC